MATGRYTQWVRLLENLRQAPRETRRELEDYEEGDDEDHDDDDDDDDDDEDEEDEDEGEDEDEEQIFDSELG